MSAYATHDTTDHSDAPTPAVLERIAYLQAIQKRNHPDSPGWQWASRELQPLFALMAQRTKGA